MGETYTRLYSLPERLYTMGAPVVVAAGALLKDNRNGNIIVQLKIQEYSQQNNKSGDCKSCIYGYSAGSSPGRRNRISVFGSECKKK